jgi:CubicO group peptidase (beta-lactamase class C family)
MTELCSLPRQPEGTPWPGDRWPEGPPPDRVGPVIERVCDALFGEEVSSDYGRTIALSMVHRGQLVFQRYARGTGPDDTQRSWSMAKSITHAQAGILHDEGRIDPYALAAIPEWRRDGDLRQEITLEHLLRMVDGLDFVEEYVEDRGSDVFNMLYRAGKDDVAAYARSRPSLHPPGTHWNYSSGTTNILAQLLADVLEGGPAAMESFMHGRLFEPLGMRSAIPRFDAAGTFIGSSFVFATPLDFARFGLLYLRDGVWEGRRLLPEGWVDHARTPTPASGGAYGAHWWLGVGGPDSFAAKGYQGQYLILDPGRDVIVLRLGESTPEQRERLEDRLRELIEAVPLR